MRKLSRKMEDSEALEYLQKGEFGVISTIGEDGYPYGVPVNYVYKDGEIFFHCATAGHKIDNFNYCDKVSFCVVGQSDVLPDIFSTRYRSVIAFGKISEIPEEEKESALELLVDKFSPDFIGEGEEHIKKYFAATKTFKIVVEHFTGKKAR
jgi:nitroimidazol reductase NimA-like FMN-containing flavoprotein (pyridoxamine 5'-phosphate oxidase superfamily)